MFDFGYINFLEFLQKIPLDVTFCPLVLKQIFSNYYNNSYSFVQSKLF